MNTVRRAVAACAALTLMTGGLVAAGAAVHADPVCPTAVAPSDGLITSADELQGLHDDRDLWDGQWQLTADIDMGGCVWTDHGIGDGITYFSGVFDGDGHTISGLTVDVDDLYVGLFGFVQTDGGTDAVIENVTFTGDVSGEGYVGGLIGNIEESAIVTNAHATGDVTAEYGVVGGLIGYIKGYDTTVVESSSASGDVLVVEGPTAGGLIGEANYADISDSYATGSATATDDAYAGGLIGYASEVTVERSYATGNVQAETETGGLIGYLDNNSAVSDSYALGTVTYTRPSDQAYVGGFAGYVNASTITDSYSVGSVIGAPDVLFAGGFVGDLDGSASVVDSYWDTETSGRDTSAGGTGLTTAEMTDIATYSAWSIAAGFDAASTWGICPAVNAGYPFLTVFHDSDPCSAPLGRRTTAPRPVYQALPLPASGSCADVDDRDLSFGSGVFGGWSRSWEPWVRTPGVEEAIGGWACVRVLEYSLSADGWGLQAG